MHTTVIVPTHVRTKSRTVEIKQTKQHYKHYLPFRVIWSAHTLTKYFKYALVQHLDCTVAT